MRKELCPRLKDGQRRKGVIMISSAIVLALILGFAALSIDLSRVGREKNKMQISVDAAALAAAQEITNAVYLAGTENLDVASALATAESNARLVASEVAAKNGVYVNPDTDVFFGKRVVADDGSYSITWGASPANVCRVQARRDNEDPTAPDARMNLVFAKAAGADTASDMLAKATAYVETRDIVLCLDYSASMNDDSDFVAMSSSRRGKSAVEDNLDDIWDTLVASGVKYSNTNGTKFPSGGYGKIDSYRGTYYNSYSNWYTYLHLDLYGVPWPQEGKDSYGSLRGQPSAYTSEYRWLNYINWVRRGYGYTSWYGYKKRYGYRTLVAYMGNQRPYNSYSEDLWRAPYYQFEGMKQGVTEFCTFLQDLNFDDHIGLVSYATTAVKEHDLYEPEPDIPVVDLGSNWITNDYTAIDTIQRHKQAGHYTGSTGIGAGILASRDMLDDHMRDGSRPAILLMTDGNANVSPSSFSLPSGWNWNEVADFDGDGAADFSTSSRSKQYAFYQAKLAVDAGYVIHTMTVGSYADEDLMKAIANLSGGVYYDVPAGSTLADFREGIQEAFARIAAHVPPARLLSSTEQ